MKYTTAILISIVSTIGFSGFASAEYKYCTNSELRETFIKKLQTKKSVYVNLVESFDVSSALSTGELIATLRCPDLLRGLMLKEKRLAPALHSDDIEKYLVYRNAIAQEDLHYLYDFIDDELAKEQINTFTVDSREIGRWFQLYTYEYSTIVDYTQFASPEYDLRELIEYVRLLGTNNLIQNKFD